MGNYTIRTMTKSDLSLAIDWAAKEGWNPGLYDIDSFYGADPSGFLMGFLDGVPISAISVVKYGSTFGFLGFYIVHPDYRGKGYGLKIWNAGLQTLKGRNIGLDGVVAQQENYRKSGFKLAYRNIRYEGTATGPTKSRSPKIRPLDNLSTDDLIEYDRSFFPEERGAFLKAWITQTRSITLGYLQHEKLAGYGTIRPCRVGFKMGPLFADSATIAHALFNALTSNVPAGDPFYLDLPEVNEAALELAQANSMTPVFETARMYTEEHPDLPLDRTFGVTSFELG